MPCCYLVSGVETELTLITDSFLYHDLFLWYVLVHHQQLSSIQSALRFTCIHIHIAQASLSLLIAIRCFFVCVLFFLFRDPPTPPPPHPLPLLPTIHVFQFAVVPLFFLVRIFLVCCVVAVFLFTIPIWILKREKCMLICYVREQEHLHSANYFGSSL